MDSQYDVEPRDKREKKIFKCMALQPLSNRIIAFVLCVSTHRENRQLLRDSRRIDCGLSMQSQTTIHVQVPNFIITSNQGNEEENESWMNAACKR